MVAVFGPVAVIVSRPVIRAIGEGWAWMLGRRRRIEVTGPSMLPTLATGEFVLIDERRPPSIGDVVVARHPDNDDLLVIKRLTGLGPDNRVSLSSDNPSAGTDSRVWGPIDRARVVGVVTLVLDRISAGGLQSPPSSDGHGPRDC